MKRKILLTLAIMAMLVFAISISVSAVTYVQDEISYTLAQGETESENTATIDSHKNVTFESTVKAIPAYIEYEGQKYNVTDMNVYNSFEGTNLTEVYFDPDCQIKRIRNFSFKNCKSLTNIVLPSQLEAIHWQAFYGCSNLTALYLPDSVKEIGYDEEGNPGKNYTTGSKEKVGVFFGCSKLYFVNNVGDTQKPDIWYAPKSLEKISGEGFKEIGTLNSVMIFGEKFTKLERGYALANKNGGAFITMIFQGDFTTEDAVFQLACEVKNRHIYFTHPNVKDTSILSYDTNYVDNTPEANIYFCSTETAYTMKGTAKGSKTPTYTALDSAFTHIIETENAGVYYENYFEKGYVVSECYCGAHINASEATLDPVVETRGVSVPESDSHVMAVVQGFKVNRDALMALGDDIDFGVIVDVNLTSEAYSPMDNGVLGNSLMSSQYSYFDIKVSGIPSEYADTCIVFCAYLKVGDKVYYLDNGTTAETVTGNSYNSWQGGAI